MKSRSRLASKILASLVLMWGALFAYEYARLPNFYTLQKSTVQVLVVNKKNDTILGHCSGVHIGGGRVLTAGHCVPDTDKVTYKIRLFEGAELIRARAEKVSFGRGEEDRYVADDIALLRTKRTLKAPRSYVSCERPEVSTTVYHVGMPHRLQWAVVKGAVVSTTARPRREPGAWLQLDMTIAQGSSGGPVFDKRGRVIGIISHTMTSVNGPFGSASTGHAFAVSGSKICSFLNR